MAPGAAPTSQDGAGSARSVSPLDGCCLNSASPAAGGEFSWRKTSASNWSGCFLISGVSTWVIPGSGTFPHQQRSLRAPPGQLLLLMGLLREYPQLQLQFYPNEKPKSWGGSDTQLLILKTLQKNWLFPLLFLLLMKCLKVHRSLHPTLSNGGDKQVGRRCSSWERGHASLGCTEKLGRLFLHSLADIKCQTWAAPFPFKLGAYARR